MTRSVFNHRRGTTASILLTQDSFNRTNSTTNPGSTDGSGSLDPAAWVVKRGTWGIISNQLYTPSGLAPFAAVCEIDHSHADVDIQVTFAALNSVGNMSIIFRDSSAAGYASANVWEWSTDDSGVSTLHKTNNGSATNVSTHAGGAAGDVMRVWCSGNTIKTYRNGTLLDTVTDNFNSTATRHGCYAQSQTGSGARFDNWTCYTAV